MITPHYHWPNDVIWNGRQENTKLTINMSLSDNSSHWDRMTHICVSKLTIIGLDNGLPPGRRQAIIWTNAGILLIGPLGTNFSEILIGIQTFSFKKMYLTMSSAKWRPFSLGLNVLTARQDSICRTEQPYVSGIPVTNGTRAPFQNQDSLSRFNDTTIKYRVTFSLSIKKFMAVS